MAITLNNLNIPYSIGLFGDGNFKVIIKQFEEEHSIFILQQVYECLMIQRYRTNYSSVFNFVKTSKLFTNNNEFYNEHQERFIYLITDGLDEELSLIKEWKKILRDKNNINIGFIFNVPDVINKTINNSDKINFDNIYKNKNFENEDDFPFEIENKNIDIYYYGDIDNDDEEKIDENELQLLINMWNNFKKLNSKNNIKTTLINVKNYIIDNLSINQLSKDFTDLLCKEVLNNNNIKRNVNYKFDNPMIKLNSIESLKNINYFIDINEQPYVKQALIKPKDFNKNEANQKQYLLLINKFKGKNIKCEKSDKISEKEFNIIKEEYFFFSISNEIIIRKLLENIFIPNKASQKVLSTTGSDIDINAFLLHYLSHDPEPMFYLEEKGGYIRKYSLTIILDLSKSSLNEFNKAHTIYTIKYLFRYLKFIDITYLDVIITSNEYPKILCSNLNSKKILNENSDFWISLFYYLCNPDEKTYLSESIDISYYLNRERNDYNNYVFILTDGLFSYEEKEDILVSVSRCAQYDIKIFGIGLGFYPININELFPYIIYSKNPEYIINAIAYFFNRNINLKNDVFKPLIIEFPKNLDDEILFLTNIKENTLTDLKFTINEKIPIDYENFDNFNKEAEIDDMKNTFNALNNPDMQLFKPGSLKGQKILIVMLWSYTLNIFDENKKIVPDYLFESRESMLKNSKLNQKFLRKYQPLKYYESKYNNPVCVENAVKRLGGEIFVVINYKDAINELCKKEKGKCPYYCVWIMSGNDKCKLPDEDSDPNLLDQFLELLHCYTKSGGSLVLFGESDPLFFQTNLFLEKHEFPTEIGNIKTKLRLCGNHEGMKILTADPIGQFIENTKFNSYKNITYSKSRRNDSYNPIIKRPSLGFNLKKFYEGETISYAKSKNEIFPFKEFAIDSEGGITILYYCGIDGHGDVIVDGGFTKCFLSMEEEGTFQYIQNLAAFTSRIECHFNKVVKPKGLTFNLKANYKPSSNFKRTIFLIDSQKYISNSNMEIIYYIIYREYCYGDIIFISNSKNYKITLENLGNMKDFIPDFNFDNNIILEELNDLNKTNLYKKIYILDVGEQVKDEFKFGDLIMIDDTIEYSITHSHYNYDPIFNYSKEDIKKILRECNDYNSFSKVFTKLRNYLYSSGDSIEDNKNNGLKLIKKKLDNLYSYNFNYFENGISIDKRYKILEWRINCGFSKEQLPTAANKNSQ